MKTVTIRKFESEIRYPHDCERIQRILYDRGYYITMDDAQDVWSEHSDRLCASWLILPEDDELVFKAVMREVEEIAEIDEENPE